MRSGVLLLAALLSVAAAPEGERFDAAAALRSVLPAEQARALSGQDDLRALASGLSPEQRQAAGAKLREAEETTQDPRDLAAIHKGYLALKDAEGAGRVGDAVVERFPQASAGYVMRGQAAELRGDMSGAVLQAQEALRRDPRDKAAFALLKLSEGRANTSGVAPTTPASDGSVAAGSFDSAPRSGASPVALDLMRQAVEARRSGDLERVHALALAAMKEDPQSQTVQRFYSLTAQDRARVESASVGLYAELRRRDLDARAERQAAADLAAARRRHAPRTPPIPPIAPIGAGGLLLTLGIMAWNRGLRDEAERRASEAARVAAAGLIVLGCAGISYGAATLLLAATPTAGPPALALAGGGAAASAAPAVAPVAAAVAGAAVGARALDHYSLAAAPTSGDGPRHTRTPKVSHAPQVHDRELQHLLNEQYRPGAVHGDGSTADALRYEMRTGKLLSKTGHRHKVEVSIKLFREWLDNHPNASHLDRATARAVLNDLVRAIAGE